ncbi:hypothetical protein MMC07_004608 [Pseudocyphellaria aurata]|nr:hypothetical protein [Pseudocyphellaria aurata]
MMLPDQMGPTATAARLPRPKDLIIDMADDLVLTEAAGRGQRVRKPREIVEEDAAKTTAPPPNKNRAGTRC